MKNTEILWSSLLLFPTLQVVESSVWINPIVGCGVSNGNQICAITAGIGPHPGDVSELPNGNDGTGDVTDYVYIRKYDGAYSTTFRYVQGLENGTTVFNIFNDPSYYLGLDITVDRDDKEEYGLQCNVTVNINGTDFSCASCSYCGRGYDNYAVDCGNVDFSSVGLTFTKPITCDESIFPIFFPLDKTNNDVSSTSSSSGNDNVNTNSNTNTNNSTPPNDSETYSSSNSLGDNYPSASNNGYNSSSSTYTFVLASCLGMVLTVFHLFHTGN